MRLSQKLAGFSKGDADVLRKAMGKKIFALLAKLKPQFLQGCEKNGHDLKIAEKIWSDWEEFAEYAFNKSHSTCYSVVAFQTGYLKANYPAEYMASVMTHNMNDIKKVTFFMDECRRMGMAVLGPDVNESQFKFAVNEKGEIRFGLGAIKGVGEGAVEAIIEERKANGKFNSIFDLTKRIDLRAANKKALESLALSGAFDSFENSHRAQYFFEREEGKGTFLESAIKFGAGFQESENSSQVSLFGDASDVKLPEPQIPICEKWGNIQELKAEKEVVGVYISGHPLDDFELVMKRYCNIHLGLLESEEAKKSPGEYKFAGIVTAVQHRMSKQNNPYGIFEIEDKEGSMEFRLFGEDYTKFRQYLDMEFFLFVRGVWKEKRWGGADGAPAEKEFKLNSIELLNGMLENKTTSMTITMPLDEVKPENISELKAFLDEHPGSCKVNMRVINKEGIWVDMHSKKIRVRPDQQLIYDIRDQLGLEVSFK